MTLKDHASGPGVNPRDNFFEHGVVVVIATAGAEATLTQEGRSDPDLRFLYRWSWHDPPLTKAPPPRPGNRTGSFRDMALTNPKQG